jgi:hypothetical protein
MNNVRYVVKMNLAGLHRCIYTCRKSKKTEWRDNKYWDKTGNVDCGDKHESIDGLVKLVFKNKKEAEAALLGAKMVANMLIRRLK